MIRYKHLVQTDRLLWVELLQEAGGSPSDFVTSLFLAARSVGMK